MTTEVLTQLRALRESIAETLRKDPRYLTLAALDKSIVEISGVLSAAGIDVPEAAAAPAAALHFESAAPSSAPPASPALTGQSSPAPTPVALSPAPAYAPTGAAPAFAPAAAAAAPAMASPAPAAAEAAVPATPQGAAAHPAAVPQASAAAPATGAAPVKKKKKKSLLTPLVATAAALAVAGVAAEVIHEHAKAATPAPKTDEPTQGDEPEDDDPTATEHPTHQEKPDPDNAEDKADIDDKDDGKGTDDDAEDKGEDDKPSEDKDEGDKPDEHKPDEDKGEEDKPDAPKAEDDEGHEAKGHEAKGEDDKSEAGDDAVIPKGKASGYTPMQPKPGAAQYQPAMSVKFGKLPNKVDLRPLMTPIEDQGDTSSCVANAVAGAYEYWIKKASKQDHNISRLFVYYNARWRDGSQDKDDGSVIQLAMEGLSKFGACNETVWPFDPHLVLKKPGAEAYQDAAPYKVHDMAQVPLKLEAWKQALAEGKPIVFGCELFDSFDECSKRGGVVPMPAPDDIARKKHSGHSMCAVGYSDSEKVFIVRNSWGADWGDKGYCYMPYAYLMSDKFNDGDCWVFIPKVPSQPPREVWSDDTKPVTNGGDGVTFPIETYTIADYAKVTVDLFENIRKPFNGVILEDFSHYVSLAGKGLWTEMESFDFRTFIASTAALAGIAAITSEFSSTSSSIVSSESLSVKSETSESSEDKESDEEQDDDEQSDDDADEDGDDDADDADEDGDDDADEDGDDDADEDGDDDADEDGDDDADEDGGDDADEDGDDDADDDGDEDDGDEDEGGDDDDGGDDESADDDGGGDDE